MTSTPKAPDPAKTASAQGQANVATATAQSLLNQYDQVGPDGSITYNQTGTNSYVDPLTGKTMTTPKFTQTTTLSPEQQKLYDLSNQTNQNLGQIGVQQSGKIGELLNTPLDINNEATEARLYDLGSKRLDPRFQQEQKTMETNLINRGIRPGSQAFKDAMDQQGRDKNDAYNQLLLTGRGQAVQEALTERNQPLNEISALLSGSQVSMPQFASNGPQSGVAGTDYLGQVNQQYQAKVQNQQNMMNGLFGLGKAAIGGWAMSDRRVKERVVRVGTTDGGVPIYKFRYRDGGPMQMGVMAQDMQKIKPSAVKVDERGILHVNYDEVA